jgi:hypothetical protein
MAHRITPSEWGRIIANSWIDPAFADQLATDPALAAKKFLGLDPGSEVRFELPSKPTDLSQAQLEDIRSGKTVSAFMPMYTC